MEHVLDNPAWSALISGNKHLANGNNIARYFDAEVSPFAALKENTVENFAELHVMVPGDKPILFVTPTQMEIPAGWMLLNQISGFQMVHNGRPLTTDSARTIALTAEHIPQMLALTKLTNPGPFGTRTIAFGHYRGIFEGDKLAAMAGQRLHAFNYQEVSAVCTHPDHLGKGYARRLLNYHINRIITEDGTPYLHVRNDNERAIKVYKDLGFAIRMDVHFYVLQKLG